MAVVCRGYVRVSTEEQAEEGYSLEAQRESIQKLADERGWNLVGTYADEGISAKDMNRPALQRLLQDLRGGEVVLCWKLDRLSRAVMDAEYIFKLFDERGVTFYSIAEPHLSTTGASGVMVRQMHTVFAEYFRRQLGENVRHGMLTKVRQGQWSGGRPPFGYDLQTVTGTGGEALLHKGRPLKKLRPNESAQIVREMYDRYLRGQTALKIATWLNASGIQSWGGKQWSQRQVSYVLENPIYAGLIKYRPKSPVEPIQVNGEHEAIIDSHTWDAVQKAREMRTQVPKRQQGNTYALTGVLRCGKCGGGIGGITRTFRLADGREETYQYYRCRTRAEKGQCSVGQMSAREIEASFVTALEEQFTAPTGIGSYLEQRAVADQEIIKADQDARKRAQKRIGEIEAALKRVDHAYFEAGILSDADYKAKRGEYQAERRLLEADLARPVPREEARDIGTLVSAVQDLRANWAELEPEEKKALALNITRGWNLRAEVHANKRVVLKLVPE